MANKRSIQDVDAQMDILYKRLTRTVNEMNTLRALRKKNGVKVSIANDELPEDNRWHRITAALN